MISVCVPGRPVPYVRMTQRGKYVKKNAKRYLEYKQSIGWAYIAKKMPKLDGKIEIGITAYLYGKTTEFGRDGDVDNYLKSAMDGLNGIAYKDDRQVVRAKAEKLPCEKGKERLEIVLKPLEGEMND